jgi:hypothetical protein
MARYKVIENGKITNIVLAEEDYAVEHGLILAEPGDCIWQEEVVVEPMTKITKLMYMNRFTNAELATIFTVAKTNIAVEVWLEKFKTAEYIDLKDQSVIDGLNTLEYSGLLAAGRARIIYTP